MYKLKYTKGDSYVDAEQWYIDMFNIAKQKFEEYVATSVWTHRPTSRSDVPKYLHFKTQFYEEYFKAVHGCKIIFMELVFDTEQDMIAFCLKHVY